MTTNQPVHEVKVGRMRVEVRANKSEDGTHYTFTIKRRERRGDSWRSASNFYGDDFQCLEKAILDAKRWLSEQAPAAGEVARSS